MSRPGLYILVMLAMLAALRAAHESKEAVRLLRDHIARIEVVTP